MTEKRKNIEEIDPKNLKSLIAGTCYMEKVFEDFCLENANQGKTDVDFRKHNKRGEEVERKTGYVYPLPPAE